MKANGMWCTVEYQQWCTWENDYDVHLYNLLKKEENNMYVVTTCSIINYYTQT